MPYAHLFCSHVYDELNDIIQPRVGERYDSRKWSGGLPPTVQPGLGLCGSKQQWQDGAHVGDALPAKWPDSDVPRCCGKPPLIGIGGEAFGQSQFLSLCSFCPLPEIMFLTFTGYPDVVPMYRAVQQCVFPVVTLNYVYDSGNVVIAGVANRYVVTCSNFGLLQLHRRGPTLPCAFNISGTLTRTGASCDNLTFIANANEWTGPATFTFPTLSV